MKQEIITKLVSMAGFYKVNGKYKYNTPCGSEFEEEDYGCLDCAMYDECREKEEMRGILDKEGK